MVNETQPGKRAPEPLRLVQRFVNSVDLEDGDEELASPEALRAWLVERDLMEAGEPVSAADLERALDVREGLRALMLANNGHDLDVARVERLDRAALRGTMRMRFGPEPEQVPAKRGVDGAIGRLMAIVAQAVADGSWERMKACSSDSCEWAFYDKSKNRSGRWCSMETCGNQDKARAFRERRRSGA